MPEVRLAIRDEKFFYTYANLKDNKTTRRIWLLALGYLMKSCVGKRVWLTQEIRNFRTDRLSDLCELEKTR